MITVQSKLLGSRRPLLDNWSLEPPADWGGGEGGQTLRALITKIVRIEVEHFRARQIKRATFQVMTAKEIDDGAARGAVRPGLQSEIQDVDEEAAVGAALTAFEDGIYLVFIDGAEQTDLDREVYLTPESTILFVRLVMLAGA